jgi:uncharacterized protein YecE (DUF72 family)
MEFGKVLDTELDNINFGLPSDHADTERLLAKSSAANTKFYVGCAKWGRKDWVGKLYPPKTKEADFLIHYARQFNTIELNSTFYKMPDERQIKIWKDKTPKGFKFCPKFVDTITHYHRLKNVKELTDEFLRAVYAFEENLGPIFLMPHPQMNPKSLEIIQSFIESIPTDIQLFIELRHPEWFNNPEAFDTAFNTFEKLKTGSVITDASGRRDCVHMRLTTNEAFIRFVGNGLHPTDYTRIDEWVARMKKWNDEGIKTIYFFMHQHEELHSPELCKYLIEKMNKTIGTTLHVPRFIENRTLFS